MANALDARSALLYKSEDYGSIKNSERGLEVTENASVTTISIALMLADEALGHKGSPKFYVAVMEAVLEANLPISFQDKMMQRELERRREQIENERKNFIAAGGRIISKRPNTRALSSNFRYLISFGNASLMKTPTVYCASIFLRATTLATANAHVANLD